MNMYLLVSIAVTALFFALIRWLYRLHQARKVAADREAREQRIHSRRMRDSGLSEPPSEPFAHSTKPRMPEFLLPGEGRRPDYYKNWGKEDWSPTIPSIIPDIPAPFPAAPRKSHVIKSYFPGPTKEVRPKLD